MLLIHLLLSSVSVECTSCDSFLRLFRNYVYYQFIFPKINKRGRWNKSGGGGGWKIFQKLISGGGTIIRYSRVGSEDFFRKHLLRPGAETILL